MATVRIPTPLRNHTGGQDVVNASGNTIGEIIDDLEKHHPGIRDKLVDDKGVRRFVNIFVGDEDIRFMEGMQTKVSDGDEISIIPAIAGGE
ncbi:MAG TPA: MoaD/ThiS family protein [Polyangiaceae bacterium]|nr:MoaD/ThiS family protein [Polyangiaceae bacterium]